MDSEKIIERRLSAAIKDMGGWAIKIPATHISGLPDRLCLLPVGRLFFVELKSEKKTARKLQLWVHRKLEKIGFPVTVIDTIDKLNEFLTLINNQP